MGMLSSLINDPLWFLEYMLYFIPALLIGLCMHEWAHAYVAYRCGDNTAAMLGRLTLNPAKHLDPVGTLMMFIVGFGWAKPVPINPRNFKHYRRDEVFVSLAGITVNLLLFLLFMTLCMIVNYFVWDPMIMQFYGLSELLSFSGSALTNIMYDGGQSLSEYFARPYLVPLLRLFGQVAQTNLLLAVFNILPIPPLDGFHVFNDILLKGKLRLNRNIAMVMQLVLLGLAFTGLLGRYISAAIQFVQGNLLRLVDLIV